MPHKEILLAITRAAHNNLSVAPSSVTGARQTKFTWISFFV